MNNSTAVSIFIGMLILVGWISLGFSGVPQSQKKIEENALLTSEAYDSNGLYHLSAIKLKEVLAEKESRPVREQMLAEFAKAYEEDSTVYNDYSNALKDSIKIYPANVKYNLDMAKLYMDKRKNRDAFKVLDTYAAANGISEEIKDLYFSLKFRYKTAMGAYESFNTKLDGGFYVKGVGTGTWSKINNGGYQEDDGKYYDYISIPDKVGTALYKEGPELKIKNNKGVTLRKILMEDFSDAKAAAEGMIAVKKGDSYYFFSYDEEISDIPTPFEDAGAFVNGEAAVKEKGKWRIINKAGEYVSDAAFDDICLNHEDKHMVDNLMAACENGSYSLYDRKNKKVTEESFEDIDCITGNGLIAAKIKGKWGYINNKGELVVQPDFDDAKSFSHGLAGVCKNGKWGIMDDNYFVGILYQFEDISYANKAHALMVKDELIGWQLIVFIVIK